MPVTSGAPCKIAMTTSQTLIAVLFSTALTSAQINTLLIIGDDMGVDTVGVYKEGVSPAPTPNIDKLAAQGVLFRNAYATPMCSSTRACYMTGRYGFRTGVGSGGAELPLSETTLPEILPSSYASALIGKWHLGGGRVANNHPNQTGWNYFAGHLGGFFTGSETYYSWSRVVQGTAGTSTTYATTANVDDALTWIKSQSGGWVCSLNFNAPHTPFHEPPSSLHTYNLAGKNIRADRLLFFKAMIQAMDTEIGRLLAGIPAATLAKTNIIFLGDNGTGGQVSEPPFTRTHAKSSIYEGGTNVPLIVSGPAVKSPGREVSAMVHAVDLFHTIAEFCGVDPATKITAELDGISMVPYLTNVNQAPLREFIYTELFGRNSSKLAVRNERYKLLKQSGVSDEYYDLEKDAFETSNMLSRTLTSVEQENLDRLKSELTRLDDEAVWFGFGTGCAGSANTPKLSASAGDRPVLGQVFSTEITDIKTGVTACMGAFGFSRTKFGAATLPLDLTSFGATGCTLYVSLDVLVPLSVSGSKSTWDLLVPPVAGLLGFRFYQQGIVFEAGANTHNAILTNAGEGCIEIK